MRLPLVLASSSPYRQRMLKQLNVEFSVISPNIDETTLPNESADELVTRLSINKATAVTTQFNQHLIIGSDQIASLDGQLIGKPNNHQQAVKQLQSCSGRVLKLHTGITLLNSKTNHQQTAVDHYQVEYKTLDLATIEQYLLLEKPYDCCGSLKAEGLGISLLTRLTGDDPNTLLGLPLIQLISMLKNENVSII